MNITPDDIREAYERVMDEGAPLSLAPDDWKADA